jgi:hypothetical protein
MHELFSVFFRAGLVLDALEEPNFDDTTPNEAGLPLSSFRNFTQIPKLLAFRLRVAGGAW